MQRPSPEAGQLLPAGFMSEPSEHSRRHSACNYTPNSTFSTSRSFEDEFQAIPQLLTKAALLEHSLQQQISSHRHSRHSQQSISGTQERRPAASRSKPRAQSCQRPATRRSRRTENLLRAINRGCGRCTQDENVLPCRCCRFLPVYSLNLNDDPSVSDRNPEDTTLMWREVRAMNNYVGSLPARSKTESSSRRTGETQSTDKKSITPSPYDTDFIQRVLKPRSITILPTRTPSAFAHAHFGVNEPVGNRAQYYIQAREAPASLVWLESGDEFVTDILREYDCMTERKLCEAEFASYARETLLKRERRIPLRDQDDQERCLKPERMIELVTEPETVGPWVRPPLIEDRFINSDDTLYTDYGFELRPDCAYWLSLQAFSHTYKCFVSDHTLVLDDNMVCPYLTIEFKRDNSEQQVALNKVAAASALALYNRFLLRKASLEDSQQKWGQQHPKPLKHYGITFSGANYNVWCTRVQLTKDYQWNGCVMERISHGTCRLAQDVRALIDWINEIHCWGLTIHGPECQNDVKMSLKAAESMSGNRVSGAGFSAATAEI